LLKSSTEGELFQAEPSNPVFINSPEPAGLMAQSRATTWEVNPNEFEHSMTLIGMVEADEANILQAGDEIGVFHEDEVRGTTTTLYIEALDIHLFFLTIYSNTEGEALHFKYVNTENGTTHDLSEILNFEINANVGTVDAPQVFSYEALTATTNLSKEISLQIIPNPFKGFANISLSLPTDDVVTIQVTDVLGNRVRSMRMPLVAGRAWIELDATDDSGTALNAGIYFVHIEGDFGNASEKILIVN